MEEEYYQNQENQGAPTPSDQSPVYPQYQNQPQIPPKPSPLATASMVTGILSIVFSCCCCGGMVFGSLAILFALLSRVDQQFESRAKTGLITGCIGWGLSLLLGILLIIVGAAESGSSLPDLNTLTILGMGGRLW